MDIEDYMDEHVDQWDEAVSAQRAINGRSAWKMEGSVGRHLMGMLNEGLCMLGHEDTHDYWGNHIPSRHQVKEGTKGSYGYVKQHRGKDYADAIAAIGQED